MEETEKNTKILSNPFECTFPFTSFHELNKINTVREIENFSTIYGIYEFTELNLHLIGIVIFKSIEENG